MQGASSYGSDSDDDNPDRSDLSTAAITNPAKPPAARLLPKASTSAANTPNSRFAQPNAIKSGSSTPAPLARRESSASPPPFRAAKSAIPDRSSVSAIEASPLDSLPQLASASSTSNPAIPTSYASTSRVPVQLDSLSEFGIPPISTEPPNPAVAAKINQFYALSQPPRSLHFNDSLASSKAFRNPRIYEKLVEFVELGDEGVSGWDRDVWDSNGLGPGATGAAISELQKARSEARNQAQTPGSRSSIAFASSSSSTAAPSHRSSSNSTSKSGGEKRSRWDNAASTSTNGGGRDGKRERSRSPKRR